MILRGIDFGNVFAAAGTLNFFGQGWRYHKLYRILFPGFNFSGSTFIAKTTPWEKRTGNMPLKKCLRPKELKLDCIRVYFRKGIVLNSVGLSSPGVHELLLREEWQKIKKPFFLSFAAIGGNKKERLIKMRLFVYRLNKCLPDFQTKIGLEINVSCPNTENDQAELAQETVELLEIAGELNIPLIVKVDPFVSIELMGKIAESKHCDGFECFNSYPVNKLSANEMEKIFGQKKSPLRHLGGGGMSGNELIMFYPRKIELIRNAGINKPIIGGGGITSKAEVWLYKSVKADAISFCSAAIIRPWRIRGIIQEANIAFGGKNGQGNNSKLV